MAGDWIKMRTELCRDPDVIQIAAELGIDEFGVVGRLHAVWSWLDAHSEDGKNVRIVTAFIDRLTSQNGFADALRSVKWLSGKDGKITFINFARHNGETAKSRASEAKRKSKQRNNRDICPTNDGTPVPQKPGPEKRREEKSIIEDTTPPPLCSIVQARSAAPMNRMTDEEADHWWHTRNASGWTKGSTAGGAARKITSWQSDMATSQSWVKESLAKQKQSPAPQPSQTKLEWEQ